MKKLLLPAGIVLFFLVVGALAYNSIFGNATAGDCVIVTVPDRGVQSRQMNIGEKYGHTALCTTPAKDTSNKNDQGYWTFHNDPAAKITCRYVDATNQRHPDLATTEFDCSDGKTIPDNTTFITYSEFLNAQVHLTQP